MDRRHFLRTGLAGISLPALVACGSDDTGALQSSTGSGPTVRPAEEVDALIAQNAFAWGVASGDPLADPPNSATQACALAGERL